MEEICAKLKSKTGLHKTFPLLGPSWGYQGPRNNFQYYYIISNLLYTARVSIAGPNMRTETYYNLSNWKLKVVKRGLSPPPCTCTLHNAHFSGENRACFGSIWQHWGFLFLWRVGAENWRDTQLWNFPCCLEIRIGDHITYLTASYLLYWLLLCRAISCLLLYIYVY